MDKTERLGNGIRVIVTREHTFGTDALLLASFADVKAKDLPIDMGTGCGIIPLLWCREAQPGRVVCMDIQSAAVQQVQRSVEQNHLQDRLSVHKWDLRNIKEHVMSESFTVVTMNPPYKPLQTGIESLSDSAKIARHEVACTVKDACTAAKYLLKYKGRFCMCHRPERLTDVLCAFREAGLEPKRLRFVSDQEGKEPFLFLVEGRKGGKSGMRLEPPLVLCTREGNPTPEMIELYGSYAREHLK